MSRKITHHQGRKKRILILCDGESEITYLKLTVAAYNVDKDLVTIINKPFKNLENVLLELEKRKPERKAILKYEEIHLICDKEELNNKKRQNSYQSFIKKVDQIRKSFATTKLKIIDSFPTFEFFLLLHFPLESKTFKKLHSNKELINLLSKQCKNYNKGNEKWLKDSIFSNDYKEKIKRAIDRAIKIKVSDNNSWSKVFETIQQIINNS
ncbi:MAG: RloB domain-containing protein [Rickettsiales bacterium]|nr:RloB domain-containing protein [Rickettsiales bacterium]